MIHTADVAESQVGIAERTGNNDGIPAERYMRGDKLAWCAGFLLWCNEVGDDDTWAPDAATYYRLRSVQAWIEWAKEKIRYHPRGLIQPRRGDVIFFGNTASDVGVVGSHVGIVTAIEGGLVHTVEGNSGNKVSRRSYPNGHRTILGYFR